MITDTWDKVGRLLPLSPSIAKLDDILPLPQENVEYFVVQDKHPVLFLVVSGSCSFATTWRETPDTKEVTALVNAKKNEFVFFLPGEPFLLKGDGKVVLYNLE